jgi:hypothetical protein
MEQRPEMSRRQEDGRSVRGEGAVGERTARSVAPPSAGGTGKRSSVGPGSPDRRASSLGELRPALSSRQALRRAILLHEILGRPKALQRPAGEISQLPDGQSPLVNGRRQDHVRQTDDRPGSATRADDRRPATEASPPGPGGPPSESRRVQKDAAIVQVVGRALAASAEAIGRRFGRESFRR